MLELYQKIYEDAHKSGIEAVKKASIVPMTVMSGSQKWFIEDGVCGFAWVKVMPANSKFARFLVQKGVAKKAYDGGVNMWIGDFNQSLQKKEVYARAFANVLKKHGVNAYADSRID